MYMIALIDEHRLENYMKNIILASGSPRRKELLSQIGLESQVITSEADESISISDPADIVMELSCRKAKAVSEMLSQKAGESGEKQNETVVIGADTIVYYNGKVLGKPVNEADAFAMIQSFAGQTHQVYTGVTVVNEQRVIQFYEKTDVTVYEMSDEEIKDYVATGDPLDKAGAYGIQGAFAAYVRKIDGDYNNVVGLPVARLYHELRKADLL